MKLFTRYNRINLTVMVLLFLLSGISYYFLINHILIHELDEALVDYKSGIENYIDRERKLPPVGLVDETRVTFTKSETQKHKEEIKTARLTNPAEKGPHNYRQITYFQKVNGVGYLITLSKPIEGTRMLTRTIMISTIVMLLIVIATSILLNQVILRRLWQPFYNSLAAVKTFKLGKKQIPEFPSTEIEEFRLMNRLLEETVSNAETDYQILKEFTENASHEMQTPLAIMRSKLDILIQEEGLSEKQMLALGSVYSGIKRLSRLNQSLLLLAKIENHQYSELSAIDLEERIEEKLSQFQEFWQNNDIHYVSDLRPAIIHSNPELIDILLSNLIGNAGRHNREAGYIFIKLQPNEFYIENTGSLKPLDSLKLFRRFYKEEQHSQHNGLGLSIVKQICDELNIQIRYSFSNQMHQFTLNWD